MKRTLLILLSTFALVNTLFSQYCPYLGPDQFLPCGVGSTTLTADLSQCGPGGANPNQTTNYGVANIPYVNQTNTGNQLFMGDDTQQGPFNIGFNFCYFGQTYTQFWVGSNGWISFSGGQPTTFTSASIPNAGFNIPKNCIMGPWQDWHPGLGGQIRYQVQGTAPCRKLVVSWIGVPMFSCTSTTGTFHIVIYESTNVIENHIQSKQFCAWANGTAVQGIHNLPGTVGITVPGRNSTQWVANNDAWRWTPSGPVVTPTLTWYQVGNPNSIGTGPTITVTPPAGGANYTCHFVYPICNAGWSTCNVGVGNLGPDTVFVQPGPPQLPNPTVVFQDPVCAGDCNGTIDVTPNGGTGIVTISWSTPNNGFNLSGLCAGNYTYNLLDAAGCTYNGSVLLTNPPIVTVSPITGSDTVCIGSNSEIYSVVNQVGYTYNWQTLGNINNGQGTNTVDVDWSNEPAGFIPGSVQVIAINQSGCTSLPSVFDLTVFSVSPSINPEGPFCSYDECVTLSAQPIGGSFFIDNQNVTQFCPQNNSSFDTVVYVYTQSGCIFYDSTNFVVNPQPNMLSISPDNSFVELCEGDSVSIVYGVQSTLNGITTWNVDNEISNGSNTISTTWNSFGIFVISAYVTTPEGCVSPEITTSLTIQECPNTLIYIPNTFTPDGDEHNNKWLPVFTSGFDPYEVEILIYNRWGETIWESHNASFGWDGTYNGAMCQNGIYVYKITYGNPKDDGRNIIFGHITLIR